MTHCNNNSRSDMPSLRARLTNAFLRLGTKRRWRPDLDIHLTRERVRRMDARLSGHGSSIAVEEIAAGGVPAAWHGDRRLSERGTLLYLHGGAWCLHLPGTYPRLPPPPPPPPGPPAGASAR